MSLRKIISRSKIAISKAQQSAGIAVPDLANRVTALEQEDQAINADITALFGNDTDLAADITALQGVDADLAADITALQNYNTAGYTGTITLVATVNFTAQTVTTKTFTYLNGKLTEVV